MTEVEQKAKEAFGLHDSRDMLRKLHWELDNLFCRQRYDVEACQYRAFNCAVTAWHVTDWLWLDLTPEVKYQLEERIQRPLKRCAQFQTYVRDACPSLYLCWQIANGSKHRLLTHSSDPTISASISDGEGYDYGNPIIKEGDTDHPADQVFYAALFWFEAFLQDWNVFPEEPFLPSGDGPSAKRIRLKQIRTPR